MVRTSPHAAPGALLPRDAYNVSADGHWGGYVRTPSGPIHWSQLGQRSLVESVVLAPPPLRNAYEMEAIAQAPHTSGWRRFDAAWRVPAAPIHRVGEPLYFWAGLKSGAPEVGAMER